VENLTNLAEEIDKAAAMHHGSQLDNAEAAYRHLLGDHPDDHNPRHLLGVLLFPTSTFDEAEKELRQAIALAGPAAPGAYHADLGNVLQRLGRMSDAESELSTAVDLDPSLAAAQSNLGVVLTETGRAEEALGPLFKAAGLAPDLAEPQINLAGDLRVAGRAAEAETCLRKAIGISPESPAAHSLLRLVLIDLKRLDEAEISCCQALAAGLSLDPGTSTWALSCSCAPSPTKPATPLKPRSRLSPRRRPHTRVYPTRFGTCDGSATRPMPRARPWHWPRKRPAAIIIWDWRAGKTARPRTRCLHSGARSIWTRAWSAPAF
jgi:Flp pilus assembly protein TadD